jgi:prophage regulatory protein
MTNLDLSHTDTTLLRRREVTRRTGLSRSSLYSRMKEGKFPKPVYLTPSTPAWLESEIAGWINGLVASRDRTLSQTAVG